MMAPQPSMVRPLSIACSYLSPSSLPLSLPFSFLTLSQHPSAPPYLTISLILTQQVYRLPMRPVMSSPSTHPDYSPHPITPHTPLTPPPPLYPESESPRKKPEDTLPPLVRVVDKARIWRIVDGEGKHNNDRSMYFCISSVLSILKPFRTCSLMVFTDKNWEPCSHCTGHFVTNSVMFPTADLLPQWSGSAFLLAASKCTHLDRLETGESSLSSPSFLIPFPLPLAFSFLRPPCSLPLLLAIFTPFLLPLISFSLEAILP